jgi:hypothetical protein
VGCRRGAFSSLPLFSAPYTGLQLVRTSVTTAGIRTTHGRRGVPLRTPSPLAKQDTNGTEHVSCPANARTRSSPSRWGEERGRCHAADCSVNGGASMVRRHSFPDMVSRHRDLRGAARRRAGRRCRGNARFPTPRGRVRWAARCPVDGPNRTPARFFRLPTRAAGAAVACCPPSRNWWSDARFPDWFPGWAYLGGSCRQRVSRKWPIQGRPGEPVLGLSAELSSGAEDGFLAREGRRGFRWLIGCRLLGCRCPDDQP